MHARLRAEAVAHALETPTVEVCGVALLGRDGGVSLKRCPNLAPDPRAAFLLGTDAFVDAHRSGARILWIYHSHPSDPVTFSEGDLASARELGIPQWVYHVGSQTWTEHIPDTYMVPALEGRPFVWGESDCYTLLRDRQRQHGIQMGDYPRDETTPWAEMGALVMDRIEAEGFVRYPPSPLIQRGDILIFRTNGSPQHFGIFEGDSRVLHHPLGGLSRKDLYSGAWQRRLHCIARYRGLTG